MPMPMPWAGSKPTIVIVVSVTLISVAAVMMTVAVLFEPVAKRRENHARTITDFDIHPLRIEQQHHSSRLQGAGENDGPDPLVDAYVTPVMLSHLEVIMAVRQSFQFDFELHMA